MEIVIRSFWPNFSTKSSKTSKDQLRTVLSTWFKFSWTPENSSEDNSSKLPLSDFCIDFAAWQSTLQTWILCRLFTGIAAEAIQYFIRRSTTIIRVLSCLFSTTDGIDIFIGPITEEGSLDAFLAHCQRFDLLQRQNCRLNLFSKPTLLHSSAWRTFAASSQKRAW